jgi:hypothetical protein
MFAISYRWLERPFETKPEMPPKSVYTRVSEANPKVLNPSDVGPALLNRRGVGGKLPTPSTL